MRSEVVVLLAKIFVDIEGKYVCDLGSRDAIELEGFEAGVTKDGTLKTGLLWSAP